MTVSTSEVVAVFALVWSIGSTVVLFFLRRSDAIKRSTREADFNRALSEQSGQLTTKLNNERVKLQQRQFILPLWSHILEMRLVSPRSLTPDNDDAWRQLNYNANTLELIALAVESEAVDDEVVRRTLWDTFVKAWENLGECKVDITPGSMRDGPALQRDNVAADTFYHQIQKSKREGGRISRLEGTE